MTLKKLRTQVEKIDFLEISENLLYQKFEKNLDIMKTLMIILLLKIAEVRMQVDIVHYLKFIKDYFVPAA